jgi:hypothetical protein
VLKFHADRSRCQGNLNVHFCATSFSLVCFWTELRPFLFRQEYFFFLEILKELHSLACNGVTGSKQYVFPTITRFGFTIIKGYLVK